MKYPTNRKTVVEVDSSNIRKRVTWFVAFVLIAVFAITYGVKGLLSNRTGWQTISAQSLYDSELSLQYNATSISERKAVYALYRDESEHIYKLLDCHNEYDGYHNLAYISHHPTEVIEVDEVLYKTFERFNDDYIYCLGGIYDSYRGLFGCINDYQASDFDPINNPMVAYDNKVYLNAVKLGDIRLELLGDNKVELKLGPSGIKCWRELGIENFVDFGWLRNAIIVDYLADQLIAGGYTNGILASYDGFTRAFCKEESLKTVIIGGSREKIIEIGSFEHSSNAAIVRLKNFSNSSLNDADYYVYSDGCCIGPYVDIEDGIAKANFNSLIVLDNDKSLVDLSLQAYKMYVSENSEVCTDNYICVDDTNVLTNMDTKLFVDMLEGYTLTKNR